MLAIMLRFVILPILHSLYYQTQHLVAQWIVRDKNILHA